jgi:hypothetical protein
MADDSEERALHKSSSEDKSNVQNLARSAKASLELQRKSLKEALDIVEGAWPIRNHFELYSGSPEQPEIDLF